MYYINVLEQVMPSLQAAMGKHYNVARMNREFWAVAFHLTVVLQLSLLFSIHIPGAIQSFGLLIALRELEEGELLVQVVSENSRQMIGYTPQELFKLRSFTDILSEEQCHNVLDHVDFIRDDEADPASDGPEVFIITIRSPVGHQRSQKLWCAMHINPANPDLIICEFELDDDRLHPLVSPNDTSSELPGDTLDSHPTQEEYEESTHILSKPLRVLRSARQRKGEAAAMEVVNIMSQVQAQLASAINLYSLLKILVGVVKELTGFHRVMIYQFDNAFNGRVVTELVDPRATKDLYKGTFVVFSGYFPQWVIHGTSAY